MLTTRLSSKGQIVIPKAIRNTRYWNPGQEFEVIETDEGVELRPSHAFSATTFDEVESSPLRYEGMPVPIEHMTGAYALRIEPELANKLGVQSSYSGEQHDST